MRWMLCWGWMLMSKIDIAKDLRKIIEANTKASRRYILQADLTNEEKTEMAEIYPVFEIGKAYTIGETVRVGSRVFEVIQSHTSQSDWLPYDVPALFKEIVPQPPGESVVVPDFVTPTSETYYKIGDLVRFNGKIYKSLLSVNTHSPKDNPAGWKEVIL